MGNIGIVKLLSTIKSPAFLLRDVNGFTPLHAAVKLGYHETAAILTGVGPPEALYMENTVGEIPMETAIQQDLTDRLRDNFTGTVVTPSTLVLLGEISTYPNPFDVPTVETRVRALRETIEELVKEGKLTPGTKLYKAIVGFSDEMGNKIAEAKVKQVELDIDDEEKDREDKKYADSRDQRKTLGCIRKAMQEKPTLRRLSIHLSDVQRSVLNNLRDAEEKAPKKRAGFHHEADEGTWSGGRNWLGSCVNLRDIPER
jgi:hypothetical protein